MTQVVTPLLLFIFLALSNFTFAQSCECVNCPRVASANSITNIRFAVAGATNNDLSDPGQGVCGVYVEFAPDHIWSLEMILTSPSGQQVTLIGPPSNTGFFSGSQTWEILFLPCSETVEPDPGFPDTWNNSTSPFSIGSAYDGSYYPHSGCLEDFNTGSVDGNWNLSINNISPFNGAFIWDFKVIFCDDSGLDCFPCDADAGSIAGYSDVTACPGDPILEIDMDPDYGITPGPDPSLFGYTYIISENDIILDYDTLPNLTTYPSGVYSICGLSYLLEDSLDVPGADGSLTLTELNDDLTGILPPFCGVVTDDCLEVLIQDIDTTFLSGIICQGDVYPFNGQDYDTTGVYYFSFPGGGPCGRAAVLDLLVLDSIQTFLQDTICTGENFCIGTDCFSTTGNYQVQLTSTVSPFCDSFVNLSLQVVPNPTIVIRDTICFGDSVVIKGEAYFNTGNYNIFPDPLITCDTFYRLRLVVIDPIIEVQEATICVGDSLEVGGQFFDSTGVYEITYSSAAMCDSILQIQLTVLDSIIVPLVDIICAGDTSWVDGIPFYESGYYEVNLTSYFDCDSLVQLDLTVQDTIKTFIRDTICEGEIYPIGTENLQTTGLYNVVLPSTSGCDTFATVNLVVLAPIVVDIDSTICQGEVITIGTREYNETGIHETTLTSINGCDSLVRLDLVVLSPSAIIEPVGLLGCDNNPVRLDASNSNGMNLIYKWVDLDNGGTGIILGADSVIAFINLAGTYQLIVTDTLNGKSCSVSNFVGIAGDLDKPIVFTSDDTLTCIDTSILLDVTTLSSSLDFSWSGPGTFQSTIQQPTVNQPGDYILITTGANQCKDTSVITIFENVDLPEISINFSDSLDCNTLSIPIQGSATGNIDSYLWTGPGTFQSSLQNITISSPGAYTFGATNISGCRADSTIWITIDTIPPEATVVGDTIICDGMDAQLSATSTDPNLLFNWEGPGTFNSTLPDPTALLSGIYDLTITATNACTNEYSVEVQIDTISPSLSVFGENLTCDSTSIELLAISDPNVDFSWSGPGTFTATIPNPVVSEAGTYYITVASANLCETVDSIIIFQDTLGPGASANGGELFCNPDSTQLFGNSPTFGSSFSWTGPSGFSTTIRNPFVSIAGEYTLVVTGPNGCTSTDTAMVIANISSPDISLESDTITCSEPIAQLTGESATMGVDFLWTGPSPFIDTALQNPTTSTPGTYYLTIIGLNGCESIDSVEVLEDRLPPDVSIEGDTLNCLLDSIQLQVSTSAVGAYVQWEGPALFNSIDLEPFVENPGQYILTLTGVNGCINSDTTIIFENKVEPGAVALGGIINCENDSVSLSGNSILPVSVTYLWSGPSTFSSSLQNPKVGVAGEYILNVIGTNGCSSADTVQVIEDEIEPGAFILGDTLTCTNDTIQLVGDSPTVGVTYSWIGPGIIVPTDQNQTVTTEGEYFLTTTGLNGCTSSDTFYVESNIEIPNILAEVFDTINCINTEVEIMGSSTTSSVTYLWEGPGVIAPSNPNQMVSISGEYSLIVESQNGCSAFDTIQVAIDTITPGASATGGILGCGTNPTVQILGNSPTVGVSYSWTAPSGFIFNTQDLVVSIPGDYILTVTATNGCESIDTALVTVDGSFPDADATVDTLFCGVDSVQLIGSSITPGVSYLWVGPSAFFETVPTPYTNEAGLYTLYVTGPNGCETPFPITVVRDTMTPQLSFSIVDTLDCLTDSIQILSSVSLPVDSYSWNGPNGFASLNADPFVRDTGVYYLSVIGENFCINTDSVLISSDTELPDIDANGGTLNCNTDSIELQGSSLTPGVSYSWASDGIFTSAEQNPIVYLPGEYYLTVMASNGCQNYDTTTVAIDTLRPTAMASGGILGCLGGGVSLNGTATGQIDSVFWEGPGGYFSSEQNPTVFSDGTYLFTVTGLNGCQAVDSAFVLEDMSAPGADIISTENTLTCLRDSIVLLGSADSSFVSFSWSGPDILEDTLQNQTVSIDGVYTLITTGLNGCTSMESFTVFTDTLVPDVLAVGDTLTCLDSLLQIIGSSTTPNVNYLWTGPGLFNVNDQDPIVNEIGEYILTVTAANGCSSSDTTNVIEIRVLPEAIAIGDTLSCLNDSIQLLGSSSTPGVGYAWVGPNLYSSNLQNPFTNQNGEYVFEVLTTEGCSSFDTVIVALDTLSPDVVAGGGVLDCLGGGVDLSGFSATAGVEYYWEGPGGYMDSIANPNVTVSGIYYLTVTAPNGCVAIDTAEVSADLSAPGATIVGDTLNCITDSIQFFGESMSGVSYVWTGPGSFAFNGQNPYVSELGTYFLTVLGANGCPSDAQFELVENISPPGAIATGDTLGCIPGVLQVLGNATDTAATYSWTGPGFTSIEQNPIVPSVGQYILTVTGANGCTETDTTFVIDNIVLPDVLAMTDTLNCKDTMVQIIGSSFTPNVTYSWEGPGGFNSMEQSPMVDTIGEYILTVLSQEGCVAKDTIIVEGNTLAPSISVIGDTITCANPLAQLGVNSSSSVLAYSWEGPGGFLSTLQNPMAQDSGKYIVSVTAENFCISTDTVLILVDSLLPGVIVAGDTIDCTVGPFFLEGNSPSSDVQYYWEGPAPFTPTNDPNPSITFSGKYILSVLGSNGCVSRDSLIIVEDVNKPQLMPVGDTLICQPDSIQIFSNSSTSGVTFNWSGPASFSSQQENPFVDTAGTYQLVVTSSNGCTTLDSAIVIDNQIYPDASAIGDTIDCDSTQITLLASSTVPGVNYSWLDPNGSVLNEQYPQVSEPGEYTLFVSGQNQCVTTATVDVFKDVDVPQVSAFGGVLNCSIDSVLIIGSSTTPSVTFEWIGPDSLLQSVEDSVMVGDPGAYTFTVESSNGCLAETTIMVTIDTILPTFDALGDTLDCNTGDGFLEVINTLPGYTYSWTGPMNFISNLVNPMVDEIGQYQVVVTGLNTCKDSMVVEVIDDPNIPVAEAGEAEDLDCNSFDVELNGSASTGDTDLEYLWINGSGINIASAAMIDVDSAGIYYLQVTNPSNGCSDVDSIIVAIDTIAPLAVVDLIGGQSITCAQTSIVLDGTGSISTDSLFYNWWLGGSVISTEINPEINDPGSYTLIVSSSVNACSDTTNFDILLDNELPIVNILVPDTLNCYQDTIFLDASNSDLGPDYELEWFGNGSIIISGNTTAMPVIDQPGNYTLVILNTQNGCKDSASIDVFSDFVYPTAEAGESGMLNCHEPVYMLNGFGSSEGIIFNYLWNGPGVLNGENGLEPEVNQPGLYFLEVLNEINGCITLDSVMVEEGNLGPSNALIDVSPSPCYGDEEGVIYIDEVVDGAEPFLYSLNGAPYVSWSQFDDLAAGTYTINIQDIDGCEFDTTLTVVDPLPLVVQLDRDTLLQLGESLIIDPIVTSSTFDLEWSYNPFLSCDSCLLQDFTPFRTSRLMLTVTDQNGCIASDEQIIYVEEGDLVFVPSAFSPDGDGTNDLLELFPSSGVVQVKTFLIFDRWGEVVHERKNFLPGDPGHGWDGRLKGKPMNPAVFVYFAELELLDGTSKFFEGSITLMR